MTRFVLPTLGLAALTACGESASSPEPVDPPDALGPRAVGHTSSIVVDPARADRMLPTELWYPADPEAVVDATPTQYPLAAGIGLDSAVAVDDVPAARDARFPLVVFSHGYGGINTQSVDLMEALASHGFVVASVAHTGNTQDDLTDSFDDAAANRVPDVSAVIDALLARDADPDDLLHERIDAERIGVVGHSFGGMTSLGVATGWAGASADPRIDAIAPVSAVVDGELQDDDRPSPNAGFTPEQLGRIEIPVMLVGGTEDVDVPIENNLIALDGLVNAPRTYKVDIIGANHTHFTNVCAIGDLLLELGLAQTSWPAIGAEALLEPYETTCSPEAFPVDEVIRLQNLFVVAFFRRHLLDQTGYDQYLTEESAEAEPAVTLQVRE